MEQKIEIKEMTAEERLTFVAMKYNNVLDNLSYEVLDTLNRNRKGDYAELWLPDIRNWGRILTNMLKMRGVGYSAYLFLHYNEWH